MKFVIQPFNSCAYECYGFNLSMSLFFGGIIGVVAGIIFRSFFFQRENERGGKNF